ncbi:MULTISPECIES: conserved phage C-terminal domain-containing protein [Staphylococcus]|uniref:conserved phage C-terminal domain-containing protein n=1 Tax=Staphylococcus TaxID=1279 RepID=UPI0008A29359|nr:MULTISPECIES: conserved phage C-terminal domain-containing protein [Staphylococcus]KAA9274643.1 replication protein [Staphylococcus epidermidis]KAB2215115.1 replication protein [Staphylococcus epidermidis]MBF2228461.1 phage protein [Staphylococcus epidermidis]MCD8856822.1 conserved phage C-terminal domain-containing protein [Staphylococcus epidermidis]MCG1423026.1 conserved phage C-terminal domain-containing protein [Staphylococcus epidermidis]
MNNRDYISSIITQFSGQNNIIPIPTIYIRITEDYPSAALLNQMIYWSDRTSRKDGYFYKSYNEWYEELHLTEYQVRRATKKLKSFGFVDTALKKANGAPTLHYKVDTKEVSEWILKKLKNGNLRNSRMDSEETQESLTEITTKTTTEITNNNILSPSSTAYPYKDVIDYLNQQTGKNYKSTTKKNQTVIRARTDEGFSLDDFKRVIDNKVAEWKGTNMEKYLRPETLFGTKFEGYLNQELQPSGMDQLERMKYDESYWD